MTPDMTPLAKLRKESWYKTGDIGETLMLCEQEILRLRDRVNELRKALKEAAGVLAAIHDAENGKIDADQGIVTLGGRGCDEARRILMCSSTSKSEERRRRCEATHASL